MAERNVTLRTRSSKVKGKQKESQKSTKKASRKKQQHHHQEDQTPPTPLMQRGHDGEWFISKKLIDTPPPNHNHFIGLLHNDTLVNVRDGIETLTALLGIDNENSILLTKSYYGAYWLMLNMIEALQFEINHRHKLITAPPKS